jgi:cytochrome c-type biogenesis protein CcmH/NrfG
MRRESLGLAVAGTFFGVLVGWIIGSQQAGTGPRPLGQPAATTAPAAGTAAAAPLDENRARALQAQAESQPGDAAVRIELGNLYFDAERFQDAIRWYEDALKIDPKNPNASTDLGAAYHTNQLTALRQFDVSLARSEAG